MITVALLFRLVPHSRTMGKYVVLSSSYISELFRCVSVKINKGMLCGANFRIMKSSLSVSRMIWLRCLYVAKIWNQELILTVAPKVLFYNLHWLVTTSNRMLLID